jgi:hypothetical protein
MSINKRRARNTFDSGMTEWHRTLSDLAAKRTLDEIEDMFGIMLNFPARLFILSLK